MGKCPNESCSCLITYLIHTLYGYYIHDRHSENAFRGFDMCLKEVIKEGNWGMSGFSQDLTVGAFSDAVLRKTFENWLDD